MKIIIQHSLMVKHIKTTQYLSIIKLDKSNYPDTGFYVDFGHAFCFYKRYYSTLKPAYKDYKKHLFNLINRF